MCHNRVSEHILFSISAFCAISSKIQVDFLPLTFWNTKTTKGEAPIVQVLYLMCNMERVKYDLKRLAVCLVT